MLGASATIERDAASAPQLDAVVVNVEQSEAAWTAYVEQHPRATGYHEWQWRSVFERAFGCEPFYLAARRGERIVGVLPTVFLDSWLFGRSLISLPYLNYGGFVADDTATERALFEYALDLARQKRCRHVELRHIEQHFPDLPCKRHKVTMLLPLQASTPMWEALAFFRDLAARHGGTEGRSRRWPARPPRSNSSRPRRSPRPSSIWRPTRRPT